MFQEKAIFTGKRWTSWSLAGKPEKNLPPAKQEITVDDNFICDVMQLDGVIAKAKEPFFGSILNMFLRVVSSFVPNDDFKYAYIIDFDKLGRVNLYISKDVWSSHAELLCHTTEDDLHLMANATREYIRYRCFVDGIQPLEQ